MEGMKLQSCPGQHVLMEMDMGMSESGTSRGFRGLEMGMEQKL